MSSMLDLFFITSQSNILSSGFYLLIPELKQVELKTWTWKMILSNPQLLVWVIREDP